VSAERLLTKMTTVDPRPALAILREMFADWESPETVPDVQFTAASSVNRKRLRRWKNVGRTTVGAH